MFAIAMWDARAKTLVLARDRLGIKPLFYAQVGQTLLFASELKSILALPPGKS
jgi:asparagine synthase (glutamine-hydrolysing)